jgi:hypothetical protein
MHTATRKRTKEQRRDLAPAAPIDASSELVELKDGPAMLALPTDRHRDFVRALYQVKSGHGSGSKAARLAGWGTPSSSAQTLATIASRLMHDERVLAAISEMDRQRIRGIAPRAISALERLVENPRHKDHARGIAMVLDREHPAETVLNVKHDATPALKATTEVLARIVELAARVGIDLTQGPMIDVSPKKSGAAI